MEYGESQEHLDRRIRQLRKYYQIQGKRSGNRFIYTLVGPKKGKIGDQGNISGRLRAEILHIAKGRCQMCGLTVENDGVRLQIDHKVPQAWGGLTTSDNLWAICDICNNGKKDYFSTYDDKDLRKIVSFPSVHERIAHLLKLNIGKPVSSRLIEFVANATERQEDWQKRLRDLRYPVIGLKIKAGKRKNAQGYLESTYTLENWKDIPPNHKKLIRDHENKKKPKQ